MGIYLLTYAFAFVELSCFSFQTLIHLFTRKSKTPIHLQQLCSRVGAGAVELRTQSPQPTREKRKREKRVCHILKDMKSRNIVQAILLPKWKIFRWDIWNKNKEKKNLPDGQRFVEGSAGFVFGDRESTLTSCSIEIFLKHKPTKI